MSEIESNTEEKSRFERFVDKLEARFKTRSGKDLKPKERADRAILRRCAGKTLAHSRAQAAVTFFELSPPRAMIHSSPTDDGYETAFLVTTLYCLTNGRGGGRLAQEMRLMARDDDKEEAVKRRIVRLLDCQEPERLAYHLRHTIKLLQSAGRGVNWYQLMKDLAYWYSPDRNVQRRWANDFARVSQDKDSDENKEGTTDAI